MAVFPGMATTTFQVAYVRCAAFYMRGFEKTMKPRPKKRAQKGGERGLCYTLVRSIKDYNRQIIKRFLECLSRCFTSEGEISDYRILQMVTASASAYLH